MAADPEALAAELTSISGYVDLFKAAYGDGEQITASLLVNEALATFERTLTSHDSPFTAARTLSLPNAG